MPSSRPDPSINDCQEVAAIKIGAEPPKSEISIITNKKFLCRLFIAMYRHHTPRLASRSLPLDFKNLWAILSETPVASLCDAPHFCGNGNSIFCLPGLEYHTNTTFAPDPTTLKPLGFPSFPLQGPM